MPWSFTRRSGGFPRRRSVGSSVDPVDLRETPRFEPSEEVIGITDPLGYFDPLGFCKQGDFEGFLGERLGKVAEMIGVF